VSDDPLYLGREQTSVKHFILRNYLQRFAFIVGSSWEVITYVDCFSGPWNVQSDKLEDSSFSIALDELRKAQEDYERRGRRIQLRCFFLEKDPAAYARLAAFSEGVKNASIETANAMLEDSIDRICDFVSRGGPKSFPFLFIDPKGWTGFDLDVITPLLSLRPGEVLINFMTGHIKRFIDSPQEETQESFRRLFGTQAFREKLTGLAHQEREDAVVREYAETVKQAGNFAYVCTSIVLHPERNSTHFHLIYATRNWKGVEVFKEAEKRAMNFQEKTRAAAAIRKREARTGQLELLPVSELDASKYFEQLRHRYLLTSKVALQSRLSEVPELSYDAAWDLVLQQPLTWESDLKAWVQGWCREDRLELLNMKPSQRVPKRNQGIILRWRP